MTLRVLIVESSRATRRLLETRMAALGFEVVTAASSNQALAKLSQVHFDAVVTSMVLPDESGIDLIRAIRNRAAISNLTTILITGDSKTLADADPGEHLGISAMLVKSIGLDLLVEQIINTISLKHAMPTRRSGFA